MGSAEISIRAPHRARKIGSGTVRVLSGFGLVLGVGTVLLLSPAATRAGEDTSVLDALFTAVSAICVTGHVLFDTHTHWEPFGQGVILALIQIGGLGYMMGTTVILWAIGRRLGVRDRELLRLYYGAPSIGETLSFARTIALYTVILEATGAAILGLTFFAEGRSAGQSAWWAVFHSVSAFNNAGFSITGNDLNSYTTDPVVLGTISTLVILGGLGAVPVFALARHRSFRRLPIDAKLIFLTSAALLMFGAAAILAFEWDNQATIATVPHQHRPLLALFQSSMARTAGFSAVPIDGLEDESKFLLVALMFIGGAAGSTAGGIKVGTFSLLFAAMLATVRGRDEAVVLRRRIPDRVVRQALVIALGAVAAVFGFALLGTLTSEDEFFLDVLFDTTSALGTVGLSTGVPTRGNVGLELVFVLAMLVGRFGPLVLVLEMTRQRRRSNFRVPEDSIRLG